MNKRKPVSKKQNSKDYKGKTRNNYRRNNNKCDTDNYDTNSPTNDVAWYEQTPELLRDAASIPFSHAAGTLINRNVTWNDEVSTTSHLTSVPGIMTLSIIPAIGDNSSPNSPVNIAANALYSFVRHANSGSKNYDAPDLMAYCIAVSQAYSYITYLQRVYGTCQLYAHYNRFLPRAVVMAQNVDPDDVNENLANFRYGINMLIHKLSSFACPANMTYFRRIAFLFSGIYSEGESIKDQMYMYVPRGFLKLNEQPTTPGWELQYTLFEGKGSSNIAPFTGMHTVDDLIRYGQNLINPLVMSEDINIMSGDILKSYGSDGILTLQSVPEDFTILPVTDLTVLEQFQNADFCVSPLSIRCKVNPDTNLLDCDIRVTMIDSSNLTYPIFHFSHLHEHVLTTILTNPTPGDIIERTRLMHTYDSEVIGEVEYSHIITGSELACGLGMWFYQDGAFRKEVLFDYAYVASDPAFDTTVRQLANHCMLENFKFHPTIYYFATYVAGKWTYFGAAIDLDNYAIISEDTLRTMNEAALLSLFRVPSIAKAYK